MQGGGVTSDLIDLGRNAQYIANHVKAGHDLSNPALVTDLHTQRRLLDRVQPDDSALAAAIAAIIGYARSQSAKLDDILRILNSVFRVPPPAGPGGTWTFTFQGRSFSGRNSVPVSIKDTDTGWGVKLGDVTDAAGEPVDPASVTVAYAVDNPDLVALTDNGDGTATFGSAIAAAGPSGIALPASAGLTATVTNTGDGTSFEVADVITVVASDAVTGDFEFTPPA